MALSAGRRWAMELDQHCIIEVIAERVIDRLKIRAVSVRGELYAVRKPRLEIAQEHHARAATAVCYTRQRTEFTSAREVMRKRADMLP